MYHILIAEDDRDLAEVMRMYLSKEEIYIYVAGDGEEAWQIFRDNHIDLALVDIMMPKINGYELIKRIRENSKIPVAILSARNRVLDKVAGMETGADLYLTKPIDMKELSASIDALLRRCYSYSTGEAGPLIRAGKMILDMEKLLLYRTEEQAGKEQPDIKHQHSGKGHQSQIQLTSLEAKLLRKLMMHPGTVFTKKQLAEEISGGWPVTDGGASVVVHISNIRNKLGREDDSIATVRGIGYLFQTGNGS